MRQGLLVFCEKTLKSKLLQSKGLTFLNKITALVLVLAILHSTTISFTISGRTREGAMNISRPSPPNDFDDEVGGET